jgi:hypothetical protein
MLEVINVLVSILNLFSTWRFGVALLVAGGSAFLASRFIDNGPLLGWTAWTLMAIGAVVGLLWQYRHEKSAK